MLFVELVLPGTCSIRATSHLGHIIGRGSCEINIAPMALKRMGDVSRERCAGFDVASVCQVMDFVWRAEKKGAFQASVHVVDLQATGMERAAPRGQRVIGRPCESTGEVENAQYSCQTWCCRDDPGAHATATQ